MKKQQGYTKNFWTLQQKPLKKEKKYTIIHKKPLKKEKKYTIIHKKPLKKDNKKEKNKKIRKKNYLDWAASAAFNSFLDLLTRSLKAFETFGGTDPSSLFKITSEIMLERTTKYFKTYTKNWCNWIISSLYI